MKIGFAMIAEESYVKSIVDIENRVSKKYPFLNNLGLVYNLPHTTIYQGTFPDQYDYENVLYSIRDKILKENKKLSLDFSCVRYIPNGWYFYCCKNTNELQDIHEFTMNLIQDDIILAPDRLNRDLSSLTNVQIDSIRKYGYRYAREAFFPHITIGRTKEDENTDLIEVLSREFKKIPFFTTVERLTVYEMGENGTHKKTKAEVYLKD